MPRQMYEYFVTYWFVSSTSHGHGSCPVRQELPIRSYDQLDGIANILRDRHNWRSVTITHFQLLTGPRVIPGDPDPAPFTPLNQQK